MTDLKIKALEPAVYVGTYGKYNNGSIDGKWLALSNYENADAFYKACRELHSDDPDPEFMFQDNENMPCEFGESGDIAEVYKLLEIIKDLDLDADVIRAGIALNIPLESIEDAYYGKYSSDIEFAEDYAEMRGFEEPMNWPFIHIDWQEAARNLMFYFQEDNDHYFSHNY